MLHAEMHSDHRQWHSENSMWKDDLAVWLREIDMVLGGLKKLEASLQKHRLSLQLRGEAIKTEERVMEEHEHAMAQFERGKSIEELDLLSFAKGHRKRADNHSRLRFIHEQLKKRHHTLIAHCSLLLEMVTRQAKLQATPRQSKLKRERGNS
jgi:hypothetical protein